MMTNIIFLAQLPFQLDEFLLEELIGLPITVIVLLLTFFVARQLLKNVAIDQAGATETEQKLLGLVASFVQELPKLTAALEQVKDVCSSYNEQNEKLMKQNERLETLLTQVMDETAKTRSMIEKVLQIIQRDYDLE